MPERLTVVATWGRAIANALEHYDCNSEAIFAQVGLDPKESYDPNAHYPIDKVAELLKLAVSTTNDEAFGLKVSRFLPNTYMPALGMLVSASENMLKGFESLCRFFKAVNDVAELDIREDGDRVFLEYRLVKDIEKLLPVDMNHHIPLEIVDATFAGLVGNVRANLDPNFSVSQVFLTRSKPDDTTAFDEMFQAPIHYSQAINKLEFDYAVLTKPLITANPEMAQVNEQIMKSLLENSNQNQMATDIQLHILEQLPTGEPSQEDIASALHLSARQLRRKLQQSGTSYAQLLQSTRHDLAKKYLLQPNLPICDIAHLLGFNDQSNFSKAFKRWEGRSPAVFRKQ
ncbi:MAG: AraC family transcriptional regulator [Cellvibrionaceae bacterium]